MICHSCIDEKPVQLSGLLRFSEALRDFSIYFEALRVSAVFALIKQLLTYVVKFGMYITVKYYVCKY